MNLQAQKVTCVTAVIEPVGNGHSVDPNFHHIPLGFDRHSVPAFLDRPTRFGVLLQPERLKVSAARLAIDSPPTNAWISWKTPPEFAVLRAGSVFVELRSELCFFS